MTDMIQKYNNMVDESILQEARALEETVFKGLLEDRSLINKLPESIFRDYFLPRFTGDIQDNVNDWVTQWISIAGTAVAEVDIFRDGTNEILFTVPPLINSSAINIYEDRAKLHDVYSHYGNISKNSPAQGMNFLLSQLMDRSSGISERNDLSPSLRAWKDIYIRYGLLKENVPVQQEQPQQDNLNDMFDFD